MNRRNFTRHLIVLFHALALLISNFTFATEPTTLSFSSLKDESNYISPSKRHLSAHSIKHIQSYLTKYGITDAHEKMIDEAIESEQITFFGYHGARREFLIFQDIIRYGVEEILGIPIRPDFHFLRIPGHPHLDVNSAKEFIDSHYKTEINDNLPMERLQLLAMNMAIYAPYREQWEFSLHYFGSNTNVAKHNYEEILAPFFIMLGVDPQHIKEAFRIGNEMLTKKSGVLLQFFDASMYQLVDQQSYLAIKKGERYYPQAPLSEYLMNPSQTHFPQFRLIINNKYTLNPNSSLSMKRYTLTSPEKFEAYQTALRNYFKTLPFDRSQRDVFREQLMSIWGEDYD